MPPGLARLHRRYAATREPRDLERLVQRYRGLACALARRYARAGMSDDDLQQVAYLGLLKALQRFEPERGYAFSTYAVPTILGELRHFCRQALWPVHVPRTVQERALAVRRATDEALATTGRRPTVRDLADRLGCDDEDILDAVHAGACLVARSLDGDGRGDDEADAPGVESWLAVEDPGFAAVEDRSVLETSLSGLTGAEREILRLSFSEALSHRQIAARVGTSASHVGRLLAATLARMSAEAQAGPGDVATAMPRRRPTHRPRLRQAA